MEITHLTLFGIPIWIWLGAAGLFMGFKAAHEDWKERRQLKKEMDESMARFKAEHRWQPKMVGGVDCGEWVRKDGTPVRNYDDE
jgi:hypothetical protein